MLLLIKELNIRRKQLIKQMIFQLTWIARRRRHSRSRRCAVGMVAKSSERTELGTLHCTRAVTICDCWLESVR